MVRRPRPRPKKPRLWWCRYRPRPGRGGEALTAADGNDELGAVGTCLDALRVNDGPNAQPSVTRLERHPEHVEPAGLVLALDYPSFTSDRRFHRAFDDLDRSRAAGTDRHANTSAATTRPAVTTTTPLSVDFMLVFPDSVEPVRRGRKQGLGPMD